MIRQCQKCLLPAAYLVAWPDEYIGLCAGHMLIKIEGDTRFEAAGHPAGERRPVQVLALDESGRQ